MEDYEGTDSAVTTCWLPLQTVGKDNTQQHLINPDTMSTLISDTLASRVEPPPFGWTYIILEQTFEYWNGYWCTKTNCQIMQSIEHPHKLPSKER